MTASQDVHVPDISQVGGRTEHTRLLRPGSTCDLRLPPDQHVVTDNSRLI